MTSSIGAVVSLERGLALLERLCQEPEGMRVVDVVSFLEVNKAIAFRLLQTLRESGYVRQEASSGRYFATFKISAIGLRKLESFGLHSWAQPLLDALALETQELVRLAVGDGPNLRWIAKAQGSRSRLLVDPASGADVVLYATASGKAWLSCFARDEAMQIVASQKPAAQTRHTHTDLGEVAAELDQVRHRGYALALEEMDDGINAVAVPVFVGASHLAPRGVGTLSVAGPAHRLQRAQLEACVPGLSRVARQLGDEWGAYERFQALDTAASTAGPA